MSFPDGHWQDSVTIGRNSDGAQRRKYVYGKTITETAQKMNELLYSTFIDRADNPMKTAISIIIPKTPGSRLI